MRFTALAATVAIAAAQTQSILQIAEATPELRDLVDAVVAGGLVNALSGPGPFTVFAPVNQAFDALGRNIIDFVFNPFNVKALDNVLTYHVASGAVYSKDLKNGEKIPTLDTESVTVSINGADIKINQATVIKADIAATNGVVHLVDGVLVPSNFVLPAKDIVQTASGVSTLSTLVKAVVAANLAEALSMPNGPYTVFAPNDAAFAKLPADTLAYLLSHPDALRNVLFYHVLDRRVYSTQITNFGHVRTLQGEELVFVIAGGKVLVNGNSTVLAADVQCTNGAVHIIDTVLIPNNVAAKASQWAATQNIVQIAEATPQLSTLVAAVTAGGLVSTLEGAGPFTVFAPTNQAFAALPADFLAYLLGNKAALDAVLTYHVVAGNVSSFQLKDGEQIPTVEGANVTAFVFDGGRRVYINEARVIEANVYASNGVVHVIDQVLLPQ